MKAKKRWLVCAAPGPLVSSGQGGPGYCGGRAGVKLGAAEVQVHKLTLQWTVWVVHPYFSSIIVTFLTEPCLSQSINPFTCSMLFKGKLDPRSS